MILLLFSGLEAYVLPECALKSPTHRVNGESGLLSRFVDRREKRFRLMELP